jgi:hypothetical protein
MPRKVFDGARKLIIGKITRMDALKALETLMGPIRERV